MTTIIGFIGGGNMAASIIGGLIAEEGEQSTADAKPGIASNIWVFDKNPNTLDVLRSSYGINVAETNEQIVEQCDVVVLAVKPQVLGAVLKPLVSAFAERQPLIISVVAGILSKNIEQWLNRELAIIRVMPNTPALVGAGASGMFANQRASQQQKHMTEKLVAAIGMGRWVENETDIDSVTALSGSGPAYFMLFIKSLIDVAIKAGLDPQTAHDLAVQTAGGAAKLIKQSEHPIGTLIDNVTSPGGTTEQALNSFAEDNLTQIVSNAFEAAKNRSQQMTIEQANAD